ncbi:PIR protein [Plasmodium ovale]|uniref:PIR protein n=1 Tax=Plasmodium ovale TaxID=36330 RepID=A0A1D3JC15_PLAOA|nr:PIR protein [Plasmodium ovale]
MSGKSSDYTLQMFVHKLYQLYNKFQNANCEDGGTNDLCIENYYNQVNPSLTELYKKLEINIKKIYKSNLPFFDGISKDIPKDKLCIYLKYWLFDEAISKGIQNADINEFFNVWEQEKEEHCSHCTCEFYTKTIPYIKYIKKFYDYFLFYDRNKSTINNEILSSPYCEYFLESFRMHESKEILCDGIKKNTPDCKEFNEYINKHIKFDKDLSNHSCNTEEREADYFEHSGSASLVLRAPQWRTSAEDEPEEYKEVPVPLHSDFVNGSEDEESTTLTIASVTVLSILIILFILYEFTPFLYFVQPGIRRFKRMVNNIVGKSTQSGTPTLEGECDNSGYAEYSMPYHSFRNS